MVSYAVMRAVNNRLYVFLLPMAVIALLATSTLAGASDDGWYDTTVSKPPKGYWFKIIVHNCLPEKAVKMHYIIDDSIGPFKDVTEKFVRTRNSYQSEWIPMAKGKFSVGVVEFLGKDGNVLLKIPYNDKSNALPHSFELTKAVPASGVALPAQKSYGKCKIIR